MTEVPQVMSSAVHPDKDPGGGNVSLLRSLFIEHMELTSIRGIRRFMNSNHTLMKILWAVYIIGMLSFLCIASVFLVQSYLKFTTLDRTTIDYHKPMTFPAVTVCYKQPFSICAMLLWVHGLESAKYYVDQLSECHGYFDKISRMVRTAEGRTTEKDVNYMSPIEFGKFIRNRSFLAISRGLLNESRIWFQGDTFPNFMDSSLVMEVEETMEMGHDFSCRLSLDLSGTANCSIRRFRHPVYPSCFTFEVGGEVPIGSSSRMILTMPRRVQSRRDMKNWFLADSLRHEGSILEYELLVSLHPKRTYPSIEHRAKMMSENRTILVEFQEVRYDRVSNPKEPCVQESKWIRYREQDYKLVERKDCVQFGLQEHVNYYCGCSASFLPKFGDNSSSLPSCNKLGYGREEETRFLTFQACLRKQLSDYSLWDEVQSRCLPDCSKTFFTFTSETIAEVSQISLMSWRTEMEKKFSRIEKMKCTENSSIAVTESCSQLVSTVMMDLQKDPPEKWTDNWSTTMLILRPDSHHVRRKNLVLLTTTQNAISQFGGLCTLALGLTPMIFLELAEFIYAVCHLFLLSKKKRRI